MPAIAQTLQRLFRAFLQGPHHLLKHFWEHLFPPCKAALHAHAMTLRTAHVLRANVKHAIS